MYPTTIGTTCFPVTKVSHEQPTKHLEQDRIQPLHVLWHTAVFQTAQVMAIQQEQHSVWTKWQNTSATPKIISMIHTVIGKVKATKHTAQCSPTSSARDVLFGVPVVATTAVVTHTFATALTLMPFSTSTSVGTVVVTVGTKLHPSPKFPTETECGSKDTYTPKAA